MECSRPVILAIALFYLAATHVQGKEVTVSNLKPKLDVQGNIVNAHDGTYRKFGDYWYYHGAEYGLCNEPPNRGCDQTSDHCGFHNNHNVSIWRSPDLSSGSWEFRGHAAMCEDEPNCKILYRPHLVYNPNTKLYVLFFNFVSNVGYGGYIVKTAPTPEGPFTLANKQMNITRLCPGPVANKPCGEAQGGAGDFDVFVDDDGQGYLMYGAQFYMSIEKLTPDFLYSTGENATAGGKFGGSVFPDYFVEAPAMFKRNGIYYALYGHCCCFCFQGSGILVYTALSPMGPWTEQSGGDLACRPPQESQRFLATVNAEPTPGQGCLYGGSTDVSVVKSQQNFVITVEADDGTLQFIWTGDRWQQAPDGLKGHEGQYWVPLKFDDKGIIAPVTWMNTFTFSVKS